MPPTPEPSQASALASAGIERAPPTSAAMSLSATAVIQAAPNDIIMANSAADATTQDALVSSVWEGDCNMECGSGGARLYRPRGIWPAVPLRGPSLLLHCVKMRAKLARSNFLAARAAPAEMKPCA